MSSLIGQKTQFVLELETAQLLIKYIFKEKACVTFEFGWDFFSKGMLDKPHFTSRKLSDTTPYRKNLKKDIQGVPKGSGRLCEAV